MKSCRTFIFKLLVQGEWNFHLLLQHVYNFLQKFLCSHHMSYFFSNIFSWVKMNWKSSCLTVPLDMAGCYIASWSFCYGPVLSERNLAHLIQIILSESIIVRSLYHYTFLRYQKEQIKQFKEDLRIASASQARQKVHKHCIILGGKSPPSSAVEFMVLLIPYLGCYGEKEGKAH